MAILDDKDVDRMEIIRLYQRGDPVFAPLDNRPIWDLEERTKDLDQIFTPGRGLRVRAEDPVAVEVEVEEGWYVVDGVTPTHFVGATGASAITIPATAAGTIRIDLIYFNLETGAVGRQSGAPAAAAAGFGSCTPPDLPAAHEGAIALAHVYVDDTPTSFADTIAIDTAGHIRDVRPAHGTIYLLEDTAGNLATDVAGGNVGSSFKIPRADHRHPTRFDDALATGVVDADAAAAPGVADYYARTDHDHIVDTEANPANLVHDSAVGAVGSSIKLVRADHSHPINVDAVLPTTLYPNNAAAVGIAAAYSRRDHQHATSMETSIATLAKDANPASLGSANRFVRSDHKHPTNVDANNPNLLAPGLPASPGVTDIYARRDHRHLIRGVGYKVGIKQWVSSSAAQNFAAHATGTLKFVLAFTAGRLDSNHIFSFISCGAASGTGSQYSVSVMEDYTAGNERGAVGYTSLAVIPGYNQMYYLHNDGAILNRVCTYFDVTAWGATSFTVDPKAGLHAGANMNAYCDMIYVAISDYAS